MMGHTTITALHANDLRLAKRVNNGDEEAFRQFFDDNYDRLYRFALTRVPHDHATAEDVVQQSFTKAISSLGNYRGEAQLFTWLCTICRNQIIDWQRKHGQLNRRVVLAEDSPEIQAIVDSFRAPESDEPFENAKRRDGARLIQVALDLLPTNYGNILEWRYIEGYSAAEIAARLKITIDATNSLTARAKRAFRDVYEPLVSDATTTGRTS